MKLSEFIRNHELEYFRIDDGIELHFLSINTKKYVKIKADYSDGFGNDAGTWFPGEWTFFINVEDGSTIKLEDDLHEGYPFLNLGKKYKSNISYE